MVDCASAGGRTDVREVGEWTVDGDPGRATSWLIPGSDGGRLDSTKVSVKYGAGQAGTERRGRIGTNGRD